MSVDGVDIIEQPAKVAVTRGRVNAKQCMLLLGDSTEQLVTLSGKYTAFIFKGHAKCVLGAHEWDSTQNDKAWTIHGLAK